jgi:hypothetical protein
MGHICWIVPGTQIKYRHSKLNGMESSEDNGVTWSFTFRSIEELRRMHPTLKLDSQYTETIDTESDDREVFGETLGDEIPEDLWTIIQS